MKGPVAVLTILVGLVIIGYSMESPIQVAGITNGLASFNSAQVILGIMVVFAGLVMIRRS